jgi:hypothetical protein
MIQLLCAVLAVPRPAFEPIDAQLRPFGMADLAVLQVVVNRTIPLHGADLEVMSWKECPWLALRPNISWPNAPDLESTLFFFDLGPLDNPKKFFPFTHAMWTGCSAPAGRALVTVDDCKHTIMPFKGPGILGREPDRYTYILFNHARGVEHVVLKGKPANPYWVNKRMTGFDFRLFRQQNPGLTPARYNFFFCAEFT